MIIGIKKITGQIDTKKLNQEEVKRIKGYGSIKRRLESFTSLYMLEEMLKDKGYNSYQIKYHRSGKPYLENIDLYFNMSHSNEYATTALCSNEVGIDIERVTPRIRRISPRFLGPENLKKFEEQEMSLLELTTLWTIKEAFTKLLGRGLTIPFNQIKVINEEDGYLVIYKDVKGFVKSFTYEDYVISVSVKQKEHLANLKPRVEMG